MPRLAALLLAAPLLLGGVARAQICVNVYYEAGTDREGSAAESCDPGLRDLEDKGGWCSESEANCEGGCGAVWCVARAEEDTAAEPSDADAPCTDMDNGLVGRFSYTCASIGTSLDKCTGYDANGFVAGDMCCQCGGGAIPVRAVPPYALQFGQGLSEYELQLQLVGPAAVAGVWTLSAWALYTADYDGCQRFMHARWWDTTGQELGTTGNDCDGVLGWPSTPDVWEQISETFDTDGGVPGTMNWFVGYNQGNTVGSSSITDLQVTGPDGTTWLDDGRFDAGSHISIWVESASYGVSAIVSTPEGESCPSCTACRAGRYRGTGGAGCSSCSAGSVTDTLEQPGATSCAACAPGQYSGSPEQSCRACAVGWVTDRLDQPGATNCSACPAGHYSSSPQESCQACPAGQYSAALHSANCTLCSSMRSGHVTDTGDLPGATACRRDCAGQVHCEWVAGPGRFVCAFGSPLGDGYRSIGNWEFDITDDAYNDGNETIVLTTAASNQFGLARFRLPSPPQWFANVFSVRFELYVGDGSGADGVCVNIGDPSPGGVAEEGVAASVSLCFDEYPNGDNENGVDMFVNGAVVWADLAECSSSEACHPLTLFEDGQWHSVEFSISPDDLGGATIAFEFDGGSSYNGTVHVDDFVPPPEESWLMFAARTGGSTNNHWVRNVAIREQVGMQPLSAIALRSFPTPTCSAATGSGAESTSGGDTQQPKLAVTFSLEQFCERPPSSPATFRKVVHAPPDPRALARSVTRRDIERLNGLSLSEAAKRIGLSEQCYERVRRAMNNGTRNDEATDFVPLATLPDEFEYVGCGEPVTVPGNETCLPLGFETNGPESAYWAAILSNRSCSSFTLASATVEALERLRAKFAGCDGVESLGFESLGSCQAHKMADPTASDGVYQITSAGGTSCESLLTHLCCCPFPSLAFPCTQNRAVVRSNRHGFLRYDDIRRWLGAGAEGIFVRERFYLYVPAHLAIQ